MNQLKKMKCTLLRFKYLLRQFNAAVLKRSGQCCYSVTLITATLVSAESQAALVHPLNDLKVIEVSISKTGLTRITVKGDRINNVFGVAGEYVMEADESQGQVFIRPIETALGPISITVTTEGGHTQDLRLFPENKPPEALILEVGENKNSGKSRRTPSASYATASTDVITRNDIEDLLYTCVRGRIPAGYLSLPLKIPEGDETHRLISEISNPKLRCLTYEVKNSGKIPLILTESEFAETLDINVLAILSPKKLLQPGESTHVFIAAKSL